MTQTARTRATRHHPRAGAGRAAARRRFDIHTVIARLRAAAPGWNAPVVTLIANQSSDPFHVLISCLLSLRTKDETTGPAAQRLFALARAPHEMEGLSSQQIERAIYPVGFYRTKARTIRELCGTLLTRHGGAVPDDLES